LPIYSLVDWADKKKGTSTTIHEEDASEEEFQAYLGVGEEEGIFDGTEGQLLQSALEFRSTLVREIMTPRDEIAAIEENSTASELKRLIVETKHSRIPVYREQLDQIVGVVYVRNLLSYLETGSDDDPIIPILAEVTIVPETKRVPILLEEMQSRAEQLALVVNEYGTISGLVTIEDLLEEIVGEIRDEDESDQDDLVDEGQGNFVVQGGAEIEDLEEAVGVDFGEHGAATVSGLVVDHLGRVPDSGEKLVLDNALIEVISADRKKIHSVRVRNLDDPDETSDG
jgi:CBS domain containing-hemolysin-like protein